MRVSCVVVMALFTLGCAGLTAPPPTIVSITVAWDGADALSVERSLLEPLEAAVSQVPGVTQVDGRADDGVARVEVTLTGDDLGAIRDAMPSSTLPVDAEPPVISRQGAGQRWLAVPLDRADHVAREIERMPGVSQVIRHGGGERRIEIEVDPSRMAAYGFDAAAVVAGIRACNVSIPAGRIDGSHEVVIRVTGGLDPSHLSDCVLGVARLGDLASVADSRAEATAAGPDGPVTILEVRTDLPTVDHVDAVALGEPTRVRPAELQSIRAAWPAAIVLADADDALVWGDLAGSPPGFQVWAPVGEVHEIVVTGEGIDETAVLVGLVRSEITAAGLSSWTDLPPDRPELGFAIDRARAADRGVSIASISDTIAVLFGGVVVGSTEGTEIRLLIEGARPVDIDSIGVMAADGSRVPLSELVVISETTTRSILHKDRQRGAVILVNGAVPDLSAVPVPPGMSIRTR